MGELVNYFLSFFFFSCDVCGGGICEHAPHRPPEDHLFLPIFSTVFVQLQYGVHHAWAFVA